MNKKLIIMLSIMLGALLNVALTVLAAEGEKQKKVSHAGHGNGFAGGGYDTRAFINGGRYNGYYYLAFPGGAGANKTYRGTYHVRRDRERFKKERSLPQHAGSRRAGTYGKSARIKWEEQS